MSPTRRKLLTVLLSLCGTVLLADVAITAFLLDRGMFAGKPLPPFGAITQVDHQGKFLAILDLPTEERGSIGRFDKQLGWTYRANAINRDGSAHTNSLGSRGLREYSKQAAPGMTRIVAFGDSFTWCEEVPDKKAWGSLLESRRAKSEVINFGVGGYGTGQAFLRYRELGRELGADVVTIGLLLENIGRNVNRYRPMWSLTSSMTRSKPRFRLEGDELVLVPQPIETEEELIRRVRDDSILDLLAEHEFWRGPDVLTGRISSLMRLAMGYVAYTDRQPRKLWIDHAGEPYRVSLSILVEFHRMAMADGAWMAPVLIFPTLEDLEAQLGKDDRYWEHLVTDLREQGVPVLDLSIPLSKQFRRLAEEGKQRSLFAGYHLSGVGNSIVADALWRFIERHRPSVEEKGKR